jgi:hypothetical protein
MRRFFSLPLGWLALGPSFMVFGLLATGPQSLPAAPADALADYVQRADDSFTW